MKILVVDDDDSIRDVLGMILSARGHEVDEAVDGADALARLGRDAPPDLVLLDMMMPRLDGEAVLEAMRRDEALARIPVVLLSGQQAARQQAEQLGVAGCLVKPIELADLLATVERMGDDGASRAPS